MKNKDEYIGKEATGVTLRMCQSVCSGVCRHHHVDMHIIASDEHLCSQYLPSNVADTQHAQLGSSISDHVSTLIAQLCLNRLTEQLYH